MKRVSEKILITSLTIVIAAILTILFISYKLSQKVHDTDVLIARTADVQAHIQKLLSAAIDNETGARGYALTGLDKFLEPLEKSEAELSGSINQLGIHSKKHSSQQPRIDSLKVLLQKRMDNSRELISLRKEKGLEAAVKFAESGEGKLYTDQIRLLTAAIQTHEKVQMEARRAENRAAITYLSRILSGLAVSIFILVILVYNLVKKSIAAQNRSQQLLLDANLTLDKDIKAKNEQLAHIFERITDAFAAVDSKWQFTFVNKKAGEILNHNPEQLIGSNIWDVFPGSETRNKPFFDAFHQAMQKQEEVYLEEYYSPFDSWVELRIYPSSDGISVFFADITEKKRAEEKVLKANRLYNFISQVNQMIVHTTDEDTLFTKVCDIAINEGQFKMAWIGIKDEASQTVIPVKFAGEERGYLSNVKISTSPVPEGNGPTGTAIREGKPFICHDISTDSRMTPWRAAALERGFMSSISAPITKFGKVTGAFTVYAAEKHFFDKEETALILEATGDISFALEIIHKEKLRREAEILLHEEKDKFKKIAETSPGLIYSFKRLPEGNVFSFPFAGKTIEDIFGFTKEQLEDDANIVVPHFHPEDSVHISESIEASAKNLTAWKCEFRYLHPEKGEIWLEGHTIPKKEADNCIAWYGVIIDTTERKKAELYIKENERKYRAFFESSMDGILLTDPDGKILAANPAACNIFNIPEAELIKRNRDQLVDITDPNLTKLLDERAKKGKARGELIMLRKTGEPFTAEISSALFKDAEGAVKSSMIIRDITARKKAEKEIQDSNFRFEVITRATNDALWEWNFETGILWGNENHQQLYGLTIEDAVPDNAMWLQRIHPEDRHIIAETQTRSLVSDKNIFISEYRFLNARNEYRNIYDRCYILRDRYLNPVRIIGSMMDITEQKKAESEIAESEKRFRNSLDKMLEGVQIIDFNWRYLYVNETAAKHGNTAKEALEGFTMQEKYPGIEQSAMFKTLQQCMQERKTAFLTNKFTYPDNSHAWFDLSIQPVPEGLFILSIDITEKKKKEEEIELAEAIIKKSEAQYKDLFNYSPLPKWIYDIETFKILDVNEATIKQYGYSRAQLTNMTVKDIRPAEDMEKFVNMKHHNAGSSAFNVGEWRHKKADGTIITVEISGHPVEYNGRSAMMIIANDITERKKSEDTIKQINNELHNLSEHLQTIREEERLQIARDLHDELGQQLTGLKLGIEWLSLKIPGEDIRLKDKMYEMIDLIKVTIQSVRRITANLRPSMLDDLGLIAALEWQSMEIKNRHGIDIIFHSNLKEPNLSLETSTALFRIYQEALTNVVRHAAASKVQSSLELVDNNIILVISDNGIGMDMTAQKEHKSFGLIGIKERTFVIGGKFEMISEPGKGTTIKIIVPV